MDEKIPIIKEKQKILIAPLNWGLGHASRCIPIINELKRQGHEIIIAADEYPFNLLKNEFPELKIINFKGIKVHYSNNNSQISAIIKCLPRMIKDIIKEHKQLREIIKVNKISLIISDNRFGLWNNNIKSIYITHQLMIKMPTPLKPLEPIAWIIHRWIINHYYECWIPDYKKAPGLSGDLSHKYPLPKNAIFIGPLSHFANIKADILSKHYENIAILSGIEPQRTLFEEQVIKIFKDSKKSSLIIRGLPKNKEFDKIECGNITIINSLSTNKIKTAIIEAKNIICRSGYSSIMDLHELNKKAILIPTPGQTEQEYLYKINK